MARLFDDASTQYLQYAGGAITAAPFTLAAWFRSDDATVNQTIIGLANSADTSNYFRLRIDGATGGDPVSLQISDSGSGQHNVATSSGFSANTWMHAAGVRAAGDNRAYLNGGSKGSSATNRTPSGINRTSIGRTSGSTPGIYFSGRVAEAAIWSAALADDDILALAKGLASPLDWRRSSLVGYWPLFAQADPEPDYSGGGFGMAVTGATAADHPPVGLGFARRGRIFLPAAGGGSQDAAASLDGVGLATIAALRDRNAACSFDGIGLATIAGTIEKNAAASLDGVGLATIAALRDRNAAAVFGGVGLATLAAEIGGTQDAAAALSGVGLATLAAVVERQASASLDGVGLAALAALRDRTASVAFAGVGLATLAPESSGGAVGPTRFASTASRLGPDPSRATSARSGPDPRQSTSEYA